MAERLIDAEALANKLQEHKDFFIDAYGGDFSFMNLKEKARIDEITNCLFEIQNAPTIEAKPVVHAHWEKDPVTGWEYCSHCKEDVPFSKYTDDVYESMFCPACGAQTDEGVKIPVISMEDVPKIMEEMENEHK